MNTVQLPKIDAMPDLLRCSDLISLGLYPSKDATYFARKKGRSPDYIKIGRKIFYLKSSVISFLSLHFKNGNSQKKSEQ